MCKTYQGWANYPTWAAMLWDQNDGGSVYDSIADEVLSGGGDIFALAQALKEYNTATAPILRGAAGDILTWAYQQIDWYEIAEDLGATWQEEHGAEQEEEEEQEQE